MNAIGKISYDALTGNTCFFVSLITKIEQNVIFPCSQYHSGGGGGGGGGSTANLYTALILDVLLLIFGLEVAQFAA